MPLLDCLRIYDQAMADFIGTFAVENRPVVTVFSTPDRPFAEVVQEMSASSEVFRSQMHETNLIASVARMDPLYNPKLRVDSRFEELMRPYNLDGDVLASEYPRPYIIPYQIDLRSRSRTDANLWMQWIQFKFNPYVCLYPDFGNLWNNQKQIQLILQSIVDNSELEKGEEERWIRWTVVIRILNAWIFPIAVDTDDIPDQFGMFHIYPVVKKVVADIYVCESSPPIPDPSLPGVTLADTVVRAQLDSAAVLPIESN